MASKSKDFENAEILRERNRMLGKALQDCRLLLKRAQELLEATHRLDPPAND